MICFELWALSCEFKCFFLKPKSLKVLRKLKIVLNDFDLSLMRSLSVQPVAEQLNRWYCHSLSHSLTESHFWFWNKYINRTPSKNDPRDLWALRHLIRVTRRHDLTKKTMTKTNTKTKTISKTNTLRENLQRATLENCDLWDTRSEWRGHMTWPKKTMTKSNTMTKTMTKREPGNPVRCRWLLVTSQECKLRWLWTVT